jgi:hypothetical protein
MQTKKKNHKRNYWEKETLTQEKMWIWMMYPVRVMKGK